ncbi:SDR family NAD(P)-dependent oxidoreductase [Muricauda oceani]|uniref:SDR family NAD(P)-dependent oxidoreductase n=1 Tax=Flagellimonas oceani TaxID=2698672 RepID=A0A6G7J2J0_9FLAO|nr:SDR family NAD(P)-dependent oxidoreductase [Allomuricauda oceani]MBW8244009.1 SDR family NAD(P)-dependent oxidoreductase [Allomuricauda oceani]QII44986.1 SDR family NAD(P)-dependent oxidoreductase [Allomuricauda oceani]
MKNDKYVAVVTEAGNGLGHKLAKILLENGYQVVLAACGESFELLSKDGEELHGYELLQVDFSSEASLGILKNTLDESYGKLDLLINNAEIVNGFGHKIDQINIEDIKEVYEINFFSIIRTIQTLKPLLNRSDDPRIINITSSLGDINKMKDEDFCYSNYSLTAYSTSKAALNMFTHLQCKEFKPSKIKMYSFDPVNMKNCTYNSVIICDGIKDEFIGLIERNPMNG